MLVNNQHIEKGLTMIMQQYKISYIRAEYAYICYRREVLGETGEIYPYPNKDTSKQQTDGSWVLFDITGERLGTVSNNGTVRTT